MEGGADVIHGRVNNVHTSGHGGQEELKMMVRLVKPKYMIPVHGEYRMQVIHTQLAQQAGVPTENTFVLSNGEVVCFGPDGARIAGHIPAGDVTLILLVLQTLATLLFMIVKFFLKKV